MANLLPISCGIVSILGIGLIVVSLATNYWKSVTVSSTESYYGLFKRCYSFKDNHKCVDLFQDFGDLPAKFAGIIATMILAVIFEGLAVIVGIAGALLKKKLIGIMSIMQALAVISSAAGLGLYAKYEIIGSWKADWSYILGWVGNGFLTIGLILVCVIMTR